jgi:hypothetical protein
MGGGVGGDGVERVGSRWGREWSLRQKARDMAGAMGVVQEPEVRMDPVAGAEQANVLDVHGAFVI